MSSKELNFKRKEKKFLVQEQSYEEIKDELESHIPVYKFNSSDEQTTIETTYLDTVDMQIFREYLARSEFRFKIRLRRYLNGDTEGGAYLVELKVKYNSTSFKRRFELPSEYLSDYLSGKPLKKEIKEANIGETGALKTSRVISELIKLNGFEPVMRSTYQRIAFQKKTRRVRITLDRNIHHEKLIGKPKTESLNIMILEAKIVGKTPKWHKKMINKLSLMKQSRFSKYATGINSLYFPSRGKYNFYDDNENCTSRPENIQKSIDILKKLFKIEDSED